MRLSQPVQVILLTAFGLSAIAAFVSVKQGKSAERAMVASVSHGLEAAYDRVLSIGRTQDEPESLSVSREIFLRVLIGDEGGIDRGTLPTFMARRDVLVPNGLISLGNEKLICVVRLSNASCVGITGNRLVRKVSEKELQSWLDAAAP